MAEPVSEKYNALLSVRGLNAWYGESQVLHGVDFNVQGGEVVTLLGRNGAGKTTTLKSVMGMVEKRTGAVQFRAWRQSTCPPTGLRALASRYARRSAAFSPA